MFAAQQGRRQAKGQRRMVLHSLNHHGVLRLATTRPSLTTHGSPGCSVAYCRTLIAPGGPYSAGSCSNANGYGDDCSLLRLVAIACSFQLLLNTHTHTLRNEPPRDCDVVLLCVGLLSQSRMKQPLTNHEPTMKQSGINP